MAFTLSLPITTFIAAPMALLMLGLGFRVAMLRRKLKIGVGVSGNKVLARAIGAHGNAVDNIPLALLLFALAEIQGVNTLVLSGCGVLFVLARILNAWGVSRHSGLSFGRFYGIILSWLITTGLVVLNLLQHLL